MASVIIELLCVTIRICQYSSSWYAGQAGYGTIDRCLLIRWTSDKEWITKAAGL